jgi:hypothetical protein
MGGRDRRDRRDEVTALFARALEGDEQADLELGRRWLDDGDPAAGRAAHALAAAALAELERDPVYRAWSDASPPSDPPLSARIAAWARPEPAQAPEVPEVSEVSETAEARLTRGRPRRT